MTTPEVFFKKLGIKDSNELFTKILPALISVFAVFISVIISFIIISVTTDSSFADLCSVFFYSSIGTLAGIGQVLTKTTIILILTIGLIVGFRSGLFNLGGVGQMAIGAVVGAGTGLFLPIPVPLRVLVGFALAFLVAGASAGILGWFKAKFNIDEIFTTLMLGFVLVAILDWLINGPWTEIRSAAAKTAVVPGSFPTIFPGLTPLIFLGLALIPISYYLLTKTPLGYEMKVVGNGRSVTKNQGINISKVMVIAMFASGGICGLAGAGQVFGDMTRIITGMPGYYGFYAIPAAIMVDYKPEYAFFSSIFLSIIIMGTLGLSSLGVISNLGEILIGIVFAVTVAVREIGRRK